MKSDLIIGHRTDPSVSIDDPKFVYVTAAKTDIRKTIEREYARLTAIRSSTPNQQDPTNVRELRRVNP
jgi:hypothetical protein